MKIKINPSWSELGCVQWNEGRIKWILYSKMMLIKKNVYNFHSFNHSIHTILTRILSHMFWKECSFHLYIIFLYNFYHKIIQLIHIRSLLAHTFFFLHKISIQLFIPLSSHSILSKWTQPNVVFDWGEWNGMSKIIWN